MDANTVIVFRTGVLGTWREKYGGIAAYAKSAGWVLQPVDARAGKPDIRAIFDFWKPVGAIVEASGTPDMFRGKDFTGVPVVFMNPEQTVHGSFSAVISDSAEIAKLAAAELMETNPASLVCVEWYRPLYWSDTKRDAMRRIAAMHGIPLTVVTPGRNDAGDPSGLARRIADAISGLPRPCGVFAMTDTIGAVVLAAARLLGAAVPEDVSVVAVDDDPEVCENCSPTLSSVRPDFKRLGFTAGRLLRRAIEHPELGARTLVVPPVCVVRRASSRVLLKTDGKVSLALDLIRNKACDGLRPCDVAALFGTTRRMAEMRFKAATGHSIGDEIIARRLDTACDYLADGKTGVAAIANFCGWNSDMAFRKAFKSRFGESPLKWARRERGK